MELICKQLRQANERKTSTLDRLRKSGRFLASLGTILNPIAGPRLSPTDTLLTSYFFILFLAKSTKLQPKCTDWKDVQITLKKKTKQPTNN